MNYIGGKAASAGVLLKAGMTCISSSLTLWSSEFGLTEFLFKGDEMGYFLWRLGFHLIFQKKAGFILDSPKEEANGLYKHLLMGERFGKVSNIANNTSASNSVVTSNLRL